MSRPSAFHPPARRPVAFVLLALCLALVPSSAALAQPREDFLRSSPKLLALFRPVVKDAAQSTVRILCDDKPAALGTVVGADGWILTKASELKGKPVVRLRDGRELEARIVGVHDQCDLAMLKIDATGLKPVAWADSKPEAAGNWVAAPGMGEEPLAVGVIGVATRNTRPRDFLPPAPPANSGYLGVALDISDDAGGAKIAQVTPDTAAARAGLKVGDVIVAVSGAPIKNGDALVQALQKRKAGEAVTLKVRRGDEELELEARLGKRPANMNRGDFQNRMGSTLSNRLGGFPAVLQHDLVLKPSDCGGPLVDLDGKVIGLNIARGGRTETYALPSDTIRPLLADLKSGKLAPPAEPAAEKKPTPEQEQKIAAAKAALKKAEAELAAAQKKVEAARAALKKAETEAKPGGAKDHEKD